MAKQEKAVAKPLAEKKKSDSIQRVAQLESEVNRKKETQNSKQNGLSIKWASLKQSEQEIKPQSIEVLLVTIRDNSLTLQAQ